MSWFPTKKQWAKWSLVSKHTTAGLVAWIAGIILCVIGIVLTAIFYVNPISEDPSSLLEKQKQLIHQLGIVTNENDEYGLTAFRVGNIYEELKEGQRFLNKLKWYRKAMLQGDKEARRKVIASYEELLIALSRNKNEVVNIFFALDQKNNLLFFEFYTVPVESLTVGSKNPHYLDYTIPDVKGEIRFVACVDVLDLIMEEDENNNCKEKRFNVRPKPG